jgi:hypothetical protein
MTKKDIPGFDEDGVIAYLASVSDPETWPARAQQMQANIILSGNWELLPAFNKLDAAIKEKAAKKG